MSSRATRKAISHQPDNTLCFLRTQQNLGPMTWTPLAMRTVWRGKGIRHNCDGMVLITSHNLVNHHHVLIHCVRASSSCFTFSSPVRYTTSPWRTPCCYCGWCCAVSTTITAIVTGGEMITRLESVVNSNTQCMVWRWYEGMTAWYGLDTMM